MITGLQIPKNVVTDRTFSLLGFLLFVALHLGKCLRSSLRVLQAKSDPPRTRPKNQETAFCCLALVPSEVRILKGSVDGGLFSSSHTLFSFSLLPHAHLTFAGGGAELCFLPSKGMEVERFRIIPFPPQIRRPRLKNHPSV